MAIETGYGRKFGEKPETAPSYPPEYLEYLGATIVPEPAQELDPETPDTV